MQVDFISVMVHELGHGLGFTKSFRENGEFGLLGDGTYLDDPACIDCLPNPYDRFLTLGSLGPTLTSLSGDARESAVTSTNVFWNGASGIAGNGGTPPKINAPTSWSDGSSLGHLDGATPALANAIMRPGIAPGVVTRTPTAVDRGILRDLGWSISVAPSSTTWTGLGADDVATTAANWSPAIPLPGDSVTFGPSPRTNVDMNLDLGSLQGISFTSTAPAFAVRFRARTDLNITGAGVANSSSAVQKLYLESSIRDDPTADHIAAKMTFQSNVPMSNPTAGEAEYWLSGGGTTIGGIAPPHGTQFLDRHPGASIVFRNSSNGGSGLFEVEGGVGDGAPGATVTFRDSSSAGSAEYRNRGGLIGPSLPVGAVAGGFGGETRFENTADAGTATFHNYGQAEHRFGSAGFTTFMDNASAGLTAAIHGTFHNHGSTINAGQGGVTRFFENSTAGAASITNHADGANGGGAAQTLFLDSSNAGTATIENQGSSAQLKAPGRTEFRGNSSAASATINNRGFITVGDLAGRTLFYDDTTAATATLRTFNGASDHGRIEFHDRSAAADANIFIEDDPMVTASHGGYVTFFNDSTAARSEITLRSGSAGFSGLQFYNNATAADAQVVTENNSGSIIFWGTSSAGDPLTADTPETSNFSLGRGSGMAFYDQSTADDAIITVANGAFLHFNMSSSAGQAQIAAAGSSDYPIAGGSVIFNSTSTINGATVFAQGGNAPLAEGAHVSFINGAHAGNSTITLTGGTNGGGGARLTFNAAAKGDTARLIAHAGATVDFFDQRLYGDTAVGSIEGAGAFWLRGSLLTVGSRNLSTIVSGPIIDHPTGFVTGGRLTKVGTGTLTLAGANTYSGVTSVNAGTLRVDGSLVGPAIVNSGGTLIGDDGAVPAGVTVNAGGVYSPGASPGTMTIGGLTMNPGGILNFELGASDRDHIVLTGGGNIVLDGILNISFFGGFTPTLGQSFALFEGAIGSVTGAFDAINAPLFNGLTLDVMQTPGSVILQVVDSTIRPGDFNGDGVVSGADLTNWKAGFNTSGSVTHTQGDADGDADVDGADFLTWQRQLGSGAPVTVASAQVPEPATLIQILAAASLRAWQNRQKKFHQLMNS
jgi:autotransporter-associated beta strand protein